MSNINYSKNIIKVNYKREIEKYKYNGLHIINYANLCNTIKEYEIARDYLLDLIRNFEKYEFTSDYVSNEECSPNIDRNFWRYTAIVILETILELINSNTQYDEHYLSAILMNTMYLYQDGTFKPENNITKAYFIKIAISILNIFYSLDSELVNGTICNEFNDVKGHWAEGYIGLALSMGLININEELLFHPNDYIINNDAIDILNKILFLEDIDSIGNVKIPTYKESENNKFSIITLNYNQQTNQILTRKDLSLLIDNTFQEFFKERLKNFNNDKLSDTLKIKLFMIFIKKYNKNNYINTSLDLLNVLFYECYDEFKKIEPEQSYIYSLISNLSNSQKEKTYKYLSNLLLSIAKIRASKFVDTSKNLKIVHYTSLSVLKLLTIKKSKFRLSNVTYLNDPSEGLVFKDLIKKQWKSSKFMELLDCFKNTTDKSCKISNTYIASFIDYEDNLPLWIHYGERAEGCSITLNKNMFNNDNAIISDLTTEKYCLYKISYISNDIKSLDKETLRQINYIKKILTECYNKENEECKKIVFSFASKMIEQISYLFKDKSYKYENETRIVAFSQLSDAKDDFNIDNESFPRVFLEMNYETKIDEIVFGPKVTKIDEKTLALLKYNAVNDLSMIRKSDIEYK